MRLKFRPKLNDIGVKGMTNYATYVQDLNNPVGVTSVPVLKGYSGGGCVCVCVCVCMCVFPVLRDRFGVSFCEF